MLTVLKDNLIGILLIVVTVGAISFIVPWLEHLYFQREETKFRRKIIALDNYIFAANLFYSELESFIESTKRSEDRKGV